MGPSAQRQHTKVPARTKKAKLNTYRVHTEAQLETYFETTNVKEIAKTLTYIVTDTDISVT